MINTAPNALQFKARVADGVLIPDENVVLAPGRTYWVTLQMTVEADETDALAKIAALAQPLGPPNLARNFDVYTERVPPNESPQ